MSKKGKKHHHDHETRPAHDTPAVQGDHAAEPGQGFGPPIEYDYEGERGVIASLDEAIAFAEPRAGSIDHPDMIWRGVLEALAFARSSRLAEEMLNARSMLETALATPRESEMDEP